LMIAPARGGQGCRHKGRRGEADRLRRERIEPFFYLRVAVGKAKSASAVMIGSGQVVPGILVQAYDKQAGDNAFRMLVHENPSAGRPGDLRELLIGEF